MRKSVKKRWCAALLMAVFLTGIQIPVQASGTEDPAPSAAAAQPAPQGAVRTAPQDSTGIPEGGFEAADGSDWNWMEDPSVKVDAAAADTAALDLPCRNALLMCTDTGDILYEKDADTQVSIASITKVMTLLLTFEAIDAGKIHMSDTVPISEHAYDMGGSQIWLEPGEQFTLEELVKAVCVNSANDAAVAVAEYVGGSESVFAEMMNAKARELGMEHTHFVNACGLDEEGHYSSARDVAKMSMALLKHPQILEYTGIWMDTLRGGETQLINTNKLLKSYQGATGLKTGTTSGAGVCIAATAQRDGMNLLAVVLGAPSSAERFVAAADLLDYGFARYELAPFPAVPGLTGEIGIRGGVAPYAAVGAQTPASLLVKKGEAADLSAALKMQPSVQAPLEQGAQVGEVVLNGPAGEIGRYAVLAKTGVETMNAKNAWQLLWKSLLAA